MGVLVGDFIFHSQFKADLLAVGVPDQGVRGVILL